ncbi:putative leucine-rich repeat-containing, plant-type, leucine-rich repeat domain superfamily [Helianthus debilis subsp. tardiflorus]
MMRNNICQKHFVLPILFYISVVLVLVSFKKTNAAYRGHQNGGAGNHKCIDKERDALLHFKAYIHQDPYGLLSTWTNEEEATDCCKWSGVTCNNRTGHVTGLELRDGNLEGQIPDCLWHFKELIVLSLGHNNLSGRLPTSIKYLINLEVLYLYKNNFSGELPLSLKNCTKLTFLELGVNNFSGYVPDWIGGNLLGLYALSLTSNNFFGTIPLQLCQLTNLQIFGFVNKQSIWIHPLMFE